MFHRTIALISGCAIPFLTCALATPAQAHIKWFAPYDVNETPRSLASIENITMLALIGAALALLWITQRIEHASFARRCIRPLERVSALLQPRTEHFLRATTGAFFVSLWAMGGIILTPELKTSSSWVPWLQLAIAAAMFWRPTLPAAALGIIVLFLAGIWDYGLFHMMDYPIFLGLAAYHALSAFSGERWRTLRAMALRVGTSASLMWASVEKLAYPHWTHPLLDAHPGLNFGFDYDLFMLIAGVVEFSLGFGLLWGPLVRRMSAVVLATMMTAAIAEFGKIDAIGHMMIIAPLIAIILDPNREQRLAWIPRVATCIPVLTYVPALIGTIAFYYASHSALCSMAKVASL